jgi:hypothetical protein
MSPKNLNHKCQDIDPSIVVNEETTKGKRPQFGHIPESVWSRHLRKVKAQARYRRVGPTTLND